MSSTPDHPVRLQPFQKVEFIRRVFECGTRKQLDDLTREIWRRYGRGASAAANQDALADLKARILERRVMLDRNDPR
jgi:hypothetical protein